MKYILSLLAMSFFLVSCGDSDTVILDETDDGGSESVNVED